MFCGTRCFLESSNTNSVFLDNCNCHVDFGMQNVHFIAPILCRRIIGDVMKAIEIENLSKAYPLYASKKDKFKEAVLPGNRK